MHTESNEHEDMAPASADVAYPTKADGEGWYYEDEAQEAMDIATKENVDGDMMKRVMLRKGRMAIMTELNKRQADKAGKIAGKNTNMVLSAYIALSTIITDKDGNQIKFVAEDLDNWKAADTNKLQAAASKLNF